MPRGLSTTTRCRLMPAIFERLGARIGGPGSGSFITLAEGDGQRAVVTAGPGVSDV
jgi:hypothetical protein